MDPASTVPGEGPPATVDAGALVLRGLALGGQLALVSFAYLLVAQSGHLDTATTTQNAFLPHATFALLIGLAVGLLPGDPAPIESGSLVRLALLRAAVTAGLLAVGCAAVLAFANEQIAVDYRAWSTCAGCAGLGTGLIVGPLAWVERAFSREPVTWRRAIDAGVVGFGIAALGLVVVSAEAAHLFALSRGEGLVESLDASRELLGKLVELPVSVAFRIFPYALPFAFLVVARTRRVGVARATSTVVAGTAGALTLWALVHAAFESRLDYVSSVFVFFPLRRGAVLAVAAGLPLGCALADAIESAWRRHEQQG